MKSHLHSQTGNTLDPRPQAATLEPVYHLGSGDAVLGFASSSPQPSDAAQHPPGIWLQDTLTRLRHAGGIERSRWRPIIVPMSSACLGDLGLPSIAEAALADTRLCPQELVFEFDDSAVASAPGDLAGLFRLYRRRGFRIGIDLRASWTSSLSGPTWLLVDTMRLCPRALFRDDSLANIAEAASYAGVSVIAEAPMWRDGELLDTFGVAYALRPQADA